MSLSALADNAGREDLARRPKDHAGARPAGVAAGLASLSIDRSGAGPAPQAQAAWVQLLRRPSSMAGVLAALVVAGAVVYSVSRPVAVRVARVINTTVSQQYAALTASGHVVAQTRAAVASKASGRLIELTVREGSRVAAGDLLARLDASDLDAAVDAARAAMRQAQAGVLQAAVALKSARADLRRAIGLQQQSFISPQSVEQVRAKADGAAANLAMATAALDTASAELRVRSATQSYTEIRAPFSGVVLAKNANVGDVITPMSNAVGAQGAVVTLADLGSLEVEVDVSEAQLGKTHVGQPAEIVLDALPELRWRGAVSTIVPTANRAKGTVTAKVRFERVDERVLPEMAARVTLLTQAVDSADQQLMLCVPMASVVGDASSSVVLRVVGERGAQRVERLPVQLGRRVGDQVEVRSAALRAGDRLVVGASHLADGAAVRVDAGD